MGIASGKTQCCEHCSRNGAVATGSGGSTGALIVGCPKFARRMDYLRDPRICK
ncbi:hypothetical protein MRX96_049419, partial [Rhipicephalus microplus]